MASVWRPDRGIRRVVVACAAAAAVLLPVGATAGSILMIGLGVWAVIAACALELVYRSQ
ncbi:hypothetical protein [Streptomyces sp. t39]|uniref:hypothetical protein n=1 Tax=Streptomyces sp. t39 TaxID=1828156 RepID=UPI00164F1BA4|nr:hypothetical protein [Streptomyces sp. t39]